VTARRIASAASVSARFTTIANQSKDTSTTCPKTASVWTPSLGSFSSRRLCCGRCSSERPPLPLGHLVRLPARLDRGVHDAVRAWGALAGTGVVGAWIAGCSVNARFCPKCGRQQLFAMRDEWNRPITTPWAMQCLNCDWESEPCETREEAEALEIEE
jgi:ribosomal protein S27AE